MSGRTLRTRRQLTPQASSGPAASTRPRRAAAQAAAPTTIERSSPDETRTSSIRLTVKADPKKLKEATGGAANSRSRNAIPAGGEIVSAPRASRKKAIVESSEDDEEEEEDFDEDAEGEEDEEMEEEEEEGDDDEEEEEEEDAEGEEDEEMEDAPPVLPKGMQSNAPVKPSITVRMAEQDKTLPSVEDKEMAMSDDEDEELSELDEDEELEGEEGLGAEDDGELDSDEDEISRSATPDPSKLTRRQRAAPGLELMALSNEAQKKKHFTAEEISMRRAEMARRRKNLSEKRNEEEKMDTINRLLKKQAPKRQRKADVEADRIAEEGEAEPERAYPVYSRFVQNATTGSVVAVPREWVDNGYVGGVFGRDGEKPKPGGGWSGRMVEVVE